MKITSAFPESFNLPADDINRRDMLVVPSAKTKLHNHHDRECWSVTAGEGLLSSGNQQITIRPGDYVELMPFDAHTVESQGSEDLRFTTHWYVDWKAVLSEANMGLLPGKVMIETAFPTPNGPLHLGHLSGAYLMSDIFKRCCELTGTESFSYCGTYGHTNHIDKTAAAWGTSYAELVARSECTIRDDLDLFQARYDDFLPHVPSSAVFEASTAKFVKALRGSPHVVEREVLHPYSEACGAFVSESYVTGQCPHCKATTIGMECENCGLYQDECRLVEPFHSVTKEKLVHRRVKRLYLRLDRDILDKLMVQMYSDMTAASRICYARLQKYLESGVLQDFPITSLRGRGVAVYGDQVLSVIMERALRSYHGLSQFTSATRHMFFCGFDNLCGSGILMPYVLKILGIPDEQLPVAVINNFCLLDNRKFSTGANHAIWANGFLRRNPSDLVRLYLSKIHNETADSNFRTDEFFDFSNRFSDALIGVFKEGQALASHYAGDRIEAGPWLKQDIIFYRELNDAMRHCIDSYTSYSPSLAVRRIDAVLRSTADYIAQSGYHQQDNNYLRTRLALVLYAYQCLAYCLYPAMPTLCGRIMDSLGVDGEHRHPQRHVVRIAEHFKVESLVNALNDMKAKVQR